MKRISRSSRELPRGGEIFVVSAPSGAGKTTLCRKLISAVPDIKFSVSCTTRSPRKGEIKNIHYTFITKEKFRKMIDKGEFAEWAVVHGNLYGTPMKKFLEMNNRGYDVILDIDTQGALQMKRRFKDAVYVFILPPSMKVLSERLRSRMSESAAEIKKRLEKAKEEIVNYCHYDYIIVNDDLKKALSELKAVITARRLRTNRVDSKRLNILKAGKSGYSMSDCNSGGRKQKKIFQKRDLQKEDLMNQI